MYLAKSSSMLRRAINKPTALSILKRRGHGGPLMPPFGRLAPPTGTIPEETELVWDDGVAPETCIDFDAHETISSSTMWASFAAGMGFFLSVYLLVRLSDPVARNPVATRREIMTAAEYREFRGHLGLGDATAAADGEGEEEEEEEDEDH